VQKRQRRKGNVVGRVLRQILFVDITHCCHVTMPRSGTYFLFKHAVCAGRALSAQVVRNRYGMYRFKYSRIAAFAGCTGTILRDDHPTRNTTAGTCRFERWRGHALPAMWAMLPQGWFSRVWRQRRCAGLDNGKRPPIAAA
jgi:hypothetical protein